MRPLLSFAGLEPIRITPTRVGARIINPPGSDEPSAKRRIDNPRSDGLFG